MNESFSFLIEARPRGNGARDSVASHMVVTQDTR
jgi:hypothetical protein